MLSTDAAPATIADVMVTALAREICDRDLLGVGLGTPLAVLAGLLARRTHAPNAHLLVGGAVDPDADFATVLAGPGALAGKTAGYVPHLETMGMAESRQMTLQILRPAQVDGQGDLNTSRIGDRERPAVRFPGGLATADVPTLLPRLVVYLPTHSLRALPAEVSCVTGSGRGRSHDPPTRGVTVVVTDRAVIEFADAPAGRTARLRSVHPWADERDVRAATGFSLISESSAGETQLPTNRERMAITQLDPGSLRVAELRKA